MHEIDSHGQIVGFQEGAVPDSDPYRGVRHPQAKLALMKFDREVVDRVKAWPVRRNDGVLLTADFLDEDLFRLHSLVDYLRINGIMQFERMGPKLQAFSDDQLRVFMLLGAAAREARGEDMIIPLGMVGWRASTRNKFKEVPGAVYYILGEHQLKDQLVVKRKIISPDEGAQE